MFLEGESWKPQHASHPKEWAIHQSFLERAVELALAAEATGNIPIGALVVLDGEIIAEGQNTLLVPHYHPGRHGEIGGFRNDLLYHPGTLCNVLRHSLATWCGYHHLRGHGPRRWVSYH